MRKVLVVVALVMSFGCGKKQDEAKLAPSPGSAGSAAAPSTTPAGSAGSAAAVGRKLDCEKVLTASIREQHFKGLKVVDDTKAPFEHVYCSFEKEPGSIEGTLTVSGCFAEARADSGTARKRGKDMPGVGASGSLSEEGPYIVASAQDDNSTCFVTVTGATEDEAKARAKAIIDVLPIP